MRHFLAEIPCCGATDEPLEAEESGRTWGAVQSRPYAQWLPRSTCHSHRGRCLVVEPWGSHMANRTPSEELALALRRYRGSGVDEHHYLGLWDLQEAGELAIEFSLLRGRQVSLVRVAWVRSKMRNLLWQARPRIRLAVRYQQQEVEG